MKDNTFASLDRTMERCSREIIARIRLLTKILRKSNQRICKKVCGTPENHKRIVERIRLKKLEAARAA